MCKEDIQEMLKLHLIRKCCSSFLCQAIEIEKSSVIPTDLFGSVRYLGSQTIAPQELITNGIAGALRVSMAPSSLREVVLRFQALSRPEQGWLEVRESGGKEPIFASPVVGIDTVGCYVVDRRYVGIRMLDKQGHPTIHIFHFGQAVGAAAFLAVLRDKFGVTVDEGEFSSWSRQPTVTKNHQQLAAVTGKPPQTDHMQARKQQGIRRKMTFKDFICSTGHRNS